MKFIKIEDIIKILKEIKNPKSELKCPSSIFGYGINAPTLIYRNKEMKVKEALAILYTILNYTEDLKLKKLTYREVEYLALVYTYQTCDGEVWKKDLVWWGEGVERMYEEGLGGLIRLCKTFLALSTFIPQREAYKCALENKIAQAPLLIMDYERAFGGLMSFLQIVNFKDSIETIVNRLEAMSFEIDTKDVPNESTISENTGNIKTIKTIKKTYLIVRDGLKGNKLTHPPKYIHFDKKKAKKELERLATSNPGCVFRLYESTESLSTSANLVKYTAK